MRVMLVNDKGGGSSSEQRELSDHSADPTPMKENGTGPVGLEV